MLFNDTFIKIMTIDLENDIVPFLAGEPGIGKSSIVKSLAKSINSKIFVVMCNQLADKGDLTGARLMPVPNKASANGATTSSGTYEQQFFPHHRVREAIEYAKANPRKTVILMLDEINRTTPDVTSAALTLSTERELGNMELPSNLKIVVAGNDKGNVTALDEASLSRFAIYHVEPEADSLIAHLGDALNPYVKAVLVKHPNLVFEKSRPTSFIVDGTSDDDDDTAQATFADLNDASEEMLQLTTPRTIEAISKWLNSCDPGFMQELYVTPTSIDDRDESVLREVIEGKIGNTDFATFLVEEIATGLSSGTTATATGSRVLVPRPECYDDFAALTSVTEMDNLIATLSDEDRNASLLYALHENKDNARLVTQLVAGGATLGQDQTRVLVQLASGSDNDLDDDNLAALYATGTTVGAQAQGLLQAMGR